MQNSFWLFGANLTIIVSGNETSGHFDMIEGFFLPGSKTPPHKHQVYSETMYVLEGEATVYTPGQAHILHPGESHFIPPNTPHAVENNSETIPFRAIVISAPGSFARLIRTVGIKGQLDSVAPEQPVDMALAARIMEEIGDVMLGPPGARP